MNDLGLRAGFVWKKDYQGWQQMNANRPLSAFNVPVTVVDPGPDGGYGNGDDGRSWRLQPEQHGRCHPTT